MSTHRFIFESSSALDEELTNTQPLHISIQTAVAKTDPPMIAIDGIDHYMVTASGLRGGIRRYCAKHVLTRLRKLLSTTQWTSETARVLLIGGVKGGADSVHLSPTQLQEIRKLCPLLDVFGMGDPVMFGGTLHMGMMVSAEPIGGKEKLVRLSIIRKPVLNDPTINVLTDISDPQTLMDDATENRTRSKFADAVKNIKAIERKLTRASISARETNALTEAKKLTDEIGGRTFANTDEREAFLETMKKDMDAKGGKSVSEQNLQYMTVIPQGTKFKHRFELFNTTTAGVGLFMAGWSDKNCFNPIVGGNAARGCGGYLKGVYHVQRQENHTAAEPGLLVHDCTIRISPDHRIEFTNADNSLLRAAYEEWLATDISQFRFDYDALMKIINGGGGE